MLAGYRKDCLKVNCSGTFVARLLTQKQIVSGALSLPMEALYSWMKLRTFPLDNRQNCFV